VQVMVYSRLGDLLRARNLSVGDLQHQIAVRFGKTVDPRMLDRLARAERVRRPDLEAAAAAAAVLDVSLSDVFTVKTSEADSVVAEQDILDPIQSERLQQLSALQDTRSLSADERLEMRALVDVYGRRVHEKGLHDIAQQRHRSLEQVRVEVAADFERRRAWWDEVQGDPVHLQALVDEALSDGQTREDRAGQSSVPPARS